MARFDQSWQCSNTSGVEGNADIANRSSLTAAVFVSRRLRCIKNALSLAGRWRCLADIVTAGGASSVPNRAAF